MNVKILFFVLLFVSIAFADSLLVTVRYDSGGMSIKYAELLSGPEPAYSNDGPFLLAYEKNSETIPATSFYMPILSNSDSGIRVEDKTETTMEIPYELGAQRLSLYDPEGKLLSSFDLSGISSAGDHKGSPPEESIAGKSGQDSVSDAVRNAVNASGAPEGAGGKPCCVGFVLPAIMMALVFVKKRN